MWNWAPLSTKGSKQNVNESSTEITDRATCVVVLGDAFSRIPGEYAA